MASADDRVAEMLGKGAAAAPQRGLRAGDAAVEGMMQGATGNIAQTDSAFARGLRSGATAAGGQMNALAGQVGELVGADDFAASQRAQSASAQALSARQSEGDVQSFRDIRTDSLSNGLRDTYDYVTGMAGRALPLIGAGVVGGALGARSGKPLGALAGATVATAPNMVGMEFEKQQADAVQAAQPLLDRTMTGIASGSAQATLMSAVPALMGGKLLAKPLQNAAGEAIARVPMSAGKAAALNGSEAVLGQAAAGYVAPMISQAAATSLNPDRDTSHDVAEREEGAVGGVALGLPFGAMGMRADMRGPKPARTDGVPLPDAAPAGAGPSLLDRAKGALGKFVTKKEPVSLDNLGAGLRPESTTVEDFALDAGIHDMPPEAHAGALEAAQQSAGAKAQENAAALRQRPDLAPEQVELLDSLEMNDPASHARVKDLVTEFKMKDRQEARAAALDEAMKAVPDDAPLDDGVLRSEDRVREPVDYTEQLDGPEWDYLGKRAKDTITRSLPKFTLLAENGRATPEMLRAMSDALGDKASDFLTKMYGDSNKGDPVKRDAYFKSLVDMTQSAKEERSLQDVVRRSIPEHLASRVDEAQIEQFVADMKDFTNEAGTRGMTPNEERIYKQKTDDKMQEIFGDKYGDVNEAFAKWATDQAEAGRGVESDAGVTGARGESDQAGVKQSVAEAEAMGLTENDLTTHYFDTTGEITHSIDDNGVFKFDRDPKFVEHRDVAMAKYSTRAEDTAHTRAERKVGDDASWTRAADFAKEIGMPKERLMELTDGRPQDFGLVSAKRFGASEDFGQADLGRMRFDTSRTTKQDGDRNMARLDTVLPDGSAGPILDGFKVVSAMQGKVKYSGEAKGGLDRTLRMFEEGIAAVQAHLGVKFTDAQLRAVEVTKGEKGKNLTYGDLLAGRDEALYPTERTEVKMLRKQLASLADEPANRTERLQIKEAIARLHDNALLPEKAIAEMDAMRARDAVAREAGDTAERAVINKAMVELRDKYATGRDGRFTDDMTTSQREARVNEMTLELDKAEATVQRLAERGAAGQLPRAQWRALKDAEFKLKNYPDIIENQSKYLTEVKEQAGFADAKGLTSEFGTGRDIGEGLNVNKQTRVADGKVIEGVREKESRSLMLEKIRDKVSDNDWAGAQKMLTNALTTLRTNGEKATGNELLIARDQFRRMREALKSVSSKDVDALDVLRGKLSDEILDLKGTAGKPDAVKLGVTEVDPSGQIHLAAADHSEAALVKRQGEDGGNLENYRKPTKADKIVPVQEAAATMANNVRAMRASGENVEVANKAQDLLNRMDQITKADQVQLSAALLKGKKMTKDVAEIIERIHTSNPVRAKNANAPAESQAVRDRNWAKNIAEGGGVGRNGEISGSAKEIQAGLVKLLRQKTPNEATKRYIAKANEQISKELEGRDNADGEVAYHAQVPGVDAINAMLADAGAEPLNSNTKVGNQRMTAAEFKEVADLVRKMLGQKVDAAFANGIRHAGEYHPVSDTQVKGLIRISVNALNPKGVAYHESLHGFFDLMGKDPATRPSLEVLTKAGNTSAMRDVFRSVFKDQPEVLKQIATSAEERAAYMFQLYAQGHPETMVALTAKPRSVLDQVMNQIRKVLGIWTNHERAMHIMDYFKDGKFAGQMDMNAVSKALMEPGQNSVVARLAKDSRPLQNLVSAFATVGSARIYDMNIGAFDSIAQRIDAGTRGEGGDAGMIRARRVEGSRMKNGFMAEIGENATTADMDAALSALRHGDVSKLSAEQRLLARTMTKHFEQAYRYMKEAGVDIGRLDFNKDYAPRVWDMHLISKDEKGFRTMLQKYVDSGELKQSSVESVINNLMGNEGGEIMVDAVSRPGNQFTKERLLKFISAADAEPFVDKNALQTITRYLDQAAKRAEWSRRFGDIVDGKPDENAKYTRAIERARRQGATDKDVELMQRYVAGVNGTLGNDMSPQLRKISSNVMIYQNIRLLPLGVFSAAIDANGILVRGGKAHEAGTAFLTALKEMRLNFQKSPDRDARYKFAEDFGVIDSVAMNHALGGATFGMAHATPALRKANDLLFRFNGMEQWNTSMRVSGAQAAIGFIRNHGDGKASPHSARYLAELGLSSKDVILGADGRPLTYKDQFVAHGMSEADAVVASNKMGLAINRWVDGAILRPDSTQKPIWFNDPHYAMFGHMKQFMYAFQETTLKRVGHEMSYGNYKPLAALGTYIPVMLAADMAKGVLLGGGSLPAWQQDWGVLDFLERAFQRAGLLGVGQMGVDTLKSLHHGGMGVGALLGPTANQAADVVNTVGGKREFSTLALDSMPAVNMLSGPFRATPEERKAEKRAEAKAEKFEGATVLR